MRESVDFSIIYNDEKLETVKMSNNRGMAGKIIVRLTNGFMQPFKIIIAYLVIEKDVNIIFRGEKQKAELFPSICYDRGKRKSSMDRDWLKTEREAVDRRRQRDWGYFFFKILL